MMKLRHRALPIVLATVLAGSVLSPAIADESIEGSTPLTKVEVSETLNCDIRYEGDELPTFYGATACGTLLVVGAELFGPLDIPAGGSASPRTAFTPVQQSKTGDGSTTSPFVITTEVLAGDTGVRLIQTDKYFSGDDGISTKMSLKNSSPTAVGVTAYRAGDCYLGDSDFGYGAQGGDWVACTSAENDRVIQWKDTTRSTVEVRPATRFEGFYDDLWMAIGRQESFSNVVRADDNHDNAAGLSWDFAMDAGGQVVLDHTLRFGATKAEVDTDGDGFTDREEVEGISAGGHFVDLKALGADPRRKDVFLKLDYMKGILNAKWWEWEAWGKPSTTRPSSLELIDLRRAFIDAPVANPDGSTGIELHVDVLPDPLSAVPMMGAKGKLGAMAKAREFRETRLNAAEQLVYRYGVMGMGLGYIEDPDSGTGLSQDPSESSGLAETPGNTFIVARQPADLWLGSRKFRGTLMHEFGHNLGLGHGGPIALSDPNLNCKPKYHSVMNYIYQLWPSAGVLQNIDYSQTSTSNLFSEGEPEGCLSNEGDPVGTRWPNGSYDAHEDWTHLLYGVGVGGLQAGDVYDVAIPAEPPVDDFSEFTPDGEGVAVLAAPSVIVRGEEATPTSLWAFVTNTSQRNTEYTLKISGDIPELSQSVTVAAGETVEVEVSMDGVPIPAPGAYSVWVTLSEPQLDVVSEIEATVVIVDPSVEEAAQASEALKKAVVPEWASQDAINDIVAALDKLSGNPEPTVTASPTPTVTSAAPTATATATATAPAPYVPQDLYEKPGFHRVNGRDWHTTCEPYSQTTRCRTEIWGTRVDYVAGQFVTTNGWMFNNLTYLPFMVRQQWADNPLGNNGRWTAEDGRRWRTECDTPTTGRNGCRSYAWSSFVASTRQSNGTWTHKPAEGWVFNNLVRFEA